MLILLGICRVSALEPAGADFYKFARTVHEKYFMDCFTYTRPWSENEIRAFLEECAERRDEFSSLENRELAILNQRRDLSRREDLLHFSDSRSGVSLDISGRGGYMEEFLPGADSEASYIIYTSGITGRGYLGERVSYFMIFNDETAAGLSELSDLEKTFTYNSGGGTVTDRYNGLYYFRREKGLGWFNHNKDRDEAYFDRTDVLFDLDLDFCVVNPGRFANSWGPGEQGNMFLSSGAMSYDQVRLLLFTGPLKLVSLTGGLRTEEYDPNSAVETANGDVKYAYRKKYIAAHRLEARIGRLTLGLNESVIYADKDVQLGYMLPLNIFWSEQHYQGDRDNTAMGFDLAYAHRWRVNLYGEFFIDDLSFRQLSDFRHTKAAYLLGFSWHPVWAEGINIRCEYERVNPFVYTHRFNVDSYTHYLTGLGSTLQPNGDSLGAAITVKAAPFIDVTAGLRFTRHGGNYVDSLGEFVNVGGDTAYPDLLSTDDDSRSLSFLGGRLMRRTAAELRLDAVLMDRRLFNTVPAGRISITGAAGYETTRFSYPPDDSGIAPEERKGWTFSLEARYNYGY